MVATEESPIALLLPGRGYTVNHPVLYYLAAVARELGWNIKAVSWDETDLSDNEVVAHGRERLASLPAGQHLVIGKSLGSLLLPDVAELGLPAIWVTPLLHRTDVRSGALRASGPSLYVGGTADESWDPEGIRQSGHEFLELENGNHGLEIDKDAAASAQFLVLLVQRTREFLAAIK